MLMSFFLLFWETPLSTTRGGLKYHQWSMYCRLRTPALEPRAKVSTVGDVLHVAQNVSQRETFLARRSATFDVFEFESVKK